MHAIYVVAGCPLPAKHQRAPVWPPKKSASLWHGTTRRLPPSASRPLPNGRLSSATPGDGRRARWLGKWAGGGARDGWGQWLHRSALAKIVWQHAGDLK